VSADTAIISAKPPSFRQYRHHFDNTAIISTIPPSFRQYRHHFGKTAIISTIPPSFSTDKTMGVRTKQLGYGHGTPCPCKGGKNTGLVVSSDVPMFFGRTLFALTLSDCSTLVFLTWLGA
jgi:hypothetical protein